MDSSLFDMLGQLLTGGASTAQIVLVMLFWSIRDDLKELTKTVRKHEVDIAEVRNEARRGRYDY